MKRICTVVGARPQFIKAAVVSKALAREGLCETLVHTGQHYDSALSASFFDELDIPVPDTNLNVGSGPHGRQTGTIMERLEAFLAGQPTFNAMLLYGDANSTLAAALVGAKLCIPIAHVEAGLRSRDRSMPEEINRILTDHVSRWLFCPTATAVTNLAREGISDGVFLSGDVMHDASAEYGRLAERQRPLASLSSFGAGEYVLVTVHRAANTDNPGRMAAILDALGELQCPVIFPIHPRTRGKIGDAELPANVHARDPVGYPGMLTLLRYARCVITDSGGLQKEAYWNRVPCVTLRDTTEWVETLENDWNTCVGVDSEAIKSAAFRTEPTEQKPFGLAPKGTASAFVARILAANFV